MPGASSNSADPDARRASSAAACQDPGLARVGGGPVIEDRAGLGQRGRSRRRPGTADRASLWGNRVQLVAGLASVGVAAAYVALRFAYTRFYDTLGVAPEDLGLGKVDLLVRSAGLILASALAGVCLLELAVGAVFLIVAVPVILKGTLDARPRLRRAWFTRGWKAGAVASVALVVALVTVGGPSVARLVEQGKAYRDWTVPWRADPATVTWLRQPPAGDPLSGRCVMYLGQANGIAVLYDVGSRRVVRVPSSEVVILIETTAHSCQGRT